MLTLLFTRILITYTNVFNSRPLLLETPITLALKRKRSNKEHKNNKEYKNNKEEVKIPKDTASKVSSKDCKKVKNIAF
jgi:hypothetical protein